MIFTRHVGRLLILAAVLGDLRYYYRYCRGLTVGAYQSFLVHHIEYFLIFVLAIRKKRVLFISMNKTEIGKLIAERRDTLDITQARLAKLSGVSVHTLSNLETGEGNVTLDTLLKVANTVGFKVRVGV